MTFLFGKWLQAMKRYATTGAHRGRGAKRLRRTVPGLEALEDRTVPSTLTVTSAADDGSAGTLRAVLAAAGSGDTIRFAHGLDGQTITLTGGELAVNKSLDIKGPGADRLTISGNHAGRVFDVSGSTTRVEISGLTVADGLVNQTTATGPFGPVALGGGILNTGAHVTLSRVVLADNQAVGPQGGYAQTNLVSDIPGLAQLTDPNLKDPWGTAHSADGSFSIADRASRVSTLYSVTAAGVSKEPLTISIPVTTFGPALQGPTGQVANDTSSFLVNGTPATFIYSDLNGTIDAWNSTLGTTAQIVVPVGEPHYTGMDIGSNTSGTFLYVADTSSRSRVDVFNGSFQPVTLGRGGWGTFTDPLLPAGLSPFNVENINGDLYVAYAPTLRKDAISATEGQGVVAVFDTNGNFIKQLISGGKLASPWGITLAPSSFGQFGGDLLVGNFSFAAPEINAFDPVTGTYLGTLTDGSGNKLLGNAQGIWDLTFGTGGNGGDPNTLYFTAGLNNETDGLFGAVAPLPGTAEGGGVANVSGGTLTLSHDLVADNQALGTFGKAEGGGVFNQGGTLTVDHSTFRDNVVRGGTRLVGTEAGSTTGAGGAIASDLAGAALTVSHSAFNDNRAIGGAGASGVRGSNGAGGGLWNGDGSTLTVSHSTFTGNQAVGGAGGAGQAGGLGNGGGLNNRDTTQASVDDSSFTDNLAIGGVGGAGGTSGAGQGGGVADGSVSAAAALTLRDSTFRGNRAVGGDGGAGGDGVGGGVANIVAVAGVGSATLTVSHTTFTDNQALGGSGSTGTGGVGHGGGIANVGNVSIATLSVTDSTLRDNRAEGGIGGSSGNGEGGGIDNDNGARLTVTGSTLSDNRAIGGRRSKEGIPPEHNGAGNGGGIRNNGTGTVAILSHTILRGNRAIGGDGVAGAAGGLGRGGAITTGFGATLTVTDSRLADNRALGGAGGAGGPGGNGGNGGSAVGGAILNASGALTVADSTFAGNQALGGAAGAGGLGGHGGAGGLALGGGIASAEPPIPPRVVPTLDVSGSTFRGNEAVGGAGAAGGAGGDGQGGALAISAGTAAITDTKITGNEAEGGAGGEGANGGNGFGGGVWVGGGVTVTVSASRITHNEAEGGQGGEGGTDGQGVGGGIYVVPGGTVTAYQTRIRRNHASAGSDDVFGSISQEG